LRTGFDRAAEDYQRTRPICPGQLFDDLIQLAGLEAGGRVIEIGCGTGQATVPLAERAPGASLPPHPRDDRRRPGGVVVNWPCVHAATARSEE
jgi:SAM-dependent methyltransferase